ncbi:MAG: hypothetical protein IPJ82_24385 [Lewinellaceae bacterium]|nr:hypothetical protein [Lewinellaceae bacterium]
MRSVLAQLEAIKGYADASDAEISAATGLNGEALHRARARWFTETLLSPLNEIRAAQVGASLEQAGFALSRGGRFYTAQSGVVNKGKAVEWMMEIFREPAAQDIRFCRNRRQSQRCADAGSSGPALLGATPRPYLGRGGNPATD